MQVCLLGNQDHKDVEAVREYLQNIEHKVSVVSPLQSDKNLLDHFHETQKTIATSDVVVAHESLLEASDAFQLAVALDSKRFILFLVSESSNRKAEISVINRAQMIVESYADNKGIRTAIDDFFVEMMNKLDAKLFMIIPPAVNKYLDWVVIHTEKSKSDVVRSAVEDVANKDKDYQAFLSQL